MSTRLSRITVVTFVLATPLHLPAMAANFQVNLDRANCQIQMTGRIEAGDLSKLMAKLGSDYLPSFAGPEICLNSEGGDFVEGLKIAEFISKGISTKVSKGARCNSACAWIFFAGTSLATGGVRSWSRSMHVSATIKMHAPYIDPTKLGPGGSGTGSLNLQDVIRAYNQAVAEIANGVLKLSMKFDSPPTSPLIHAALLARILATTGPDKYIEIGTVDQAIYWDFTVTGYKPLVPRTRADLVRACTKASSRANQWQESPIDVTVAEGYSAIYDKSRRTLVANVVVSGIGGLACVIRAEFAEDLRSLTKDMEILANANGVGAFAKVWVKATRNPTTVHLPDFSILPAGTRLDTIASRSQQTSDPGAFDTVGAPKLCANDRPKSVEEAAVCADGELSGYQAVLEKFHVNYRQQKGSEEAVLRRTHRRFIARRKLCGDDAACLKETYLSELAKFNDGLGLY